MEVLNNILTFFQSIGVEWFLGWKTLTPLAVGILVQACLIVILILVFKLFKNTKFGITFELFFESMYEFFEEILGTKEKKWVKSYIISLFMIILLINLSGWMLDRIRIMFVENGVFVNEAFEQFVLIPTAQFEFNIALALVSVLISLFVQIKFLGVFKFIHEYLPVFGKGILDIDRGEMKAIVYYPIKVIVKIFDIAISLFVWVLDIVGIVAKIVSLSARLFGNMLSWGILLGLLVGAISAATLSFANFDFPVIAPLILFVQWLLVAVIQALVFPLLSAIFIKIGQEA